MANAVLLNNQVLQCIGIDYEMKGTIYTRVCRALETPYEFSRSVIYGEIDALVSLGYVQLWEESYGTAAIWRYYRITEKGKRKLARLRKETKANADH